MLWDMSGVPQQPLERLHDAARWSWTSLGRPQQPWSVLLWTSSDSSGAFLDILGRVQARPFDKAAEHVQDAQGRPGTCLRRSGKLWDVSETRSR